MEKGSPNQAAAAAELPDDLVVEILARLPARTLCRCKCVSRSWRALIADPAHRARLAQTLTGFFVFSRPHSADAPSSWSFITTTEGGAPLVDTALSFLPPSYGEINMLDSCNGLLLLRCSSDHDHQPSPRRQQHDPFYVVCNPATGEWVALPQPSQIPGQRGGLQGYGNKTTFAALGFDHTVSSHFYVFQLVERKLLFDDAIRAVEIYSSATGTWITRQSGWDRVVFFGGHKTYFKGFLYLTTSLLHHAIAAVDTKGQTWRFTQVLDPIEGITCDFVGHSQGCLLYVVEDRPGNSLSIYGLEDHENEESTIKHSVSRTDLFGPRKSSQWGMEQKKVTFHPDGDLIFFYDQPRERFMYYDMTRRDLNVICAVGGAECCEHLFLPYIPFYKRSLLAPPN